MVSVSAFTYVSVSVSNNVFVVYESVMLSKHVSASTTVYETIIHFTYTLSLFMYSACVSVSVLVPVNM